jgi:bifunctional DNA-binding transcriptional regulator/antitoxin component of YhaV-PrlF toxin-antitoxin module
MIETLEKQWTDGRTGTAGQVAGDLVLADLSRKYGAISRLKGTVFTTPTHIVIGRICGSNRYLLTPEVHWSTFSPGQEDDLRIDGALAERSIVYLFATLIPATSSVEYWLIPSRILKGALAAIKPRRDGDLIVRIHQRGDKTYLYETDVTGFHCTVPLNSEARKRLDAAANNQARHAERASTLKVISGEPGNTELSNLSDSDLPNKYCDAFRVSTIIMGREGSLSLPAWLREQLGLREGMRALAFQDGRRIVLQPVRLGEFRSARGSLKGTGALEALVDERRREKEL